MGRRSVKKLTALGETRTVAEWAVISKVPRELLYNRIQKGMTADQALFTPVKGRAPMRPRKIHVDQSAYKVMLGLIAKERTRNYRMVGLWYKLFQLEDRYAVMKVA